MGTRASFWIGDPTDLEKRKWLGCIAWGGHPENFEHFAPMDDTQFMGTVEEMSRTRKDFATPTKGWPFPWHDDIFLTDVTYAYFDGAVQVCWFHKPFQSLLVYLTDTTEEDEEPKDDPRHKKVPAPVAYDRTQPDSIIIVSF